MTQEPTLTKGAGIIVQDGFDYSGIVPFADAHVLEGSAITTTTYGTASHGCGAGPSGVVGCYYGQLLLVDYLWLVPAGATKVLKMHKHTGAMTGYNAWPAGLTNPPGSTADPSFVGGVYDQKLNTIWMIALDASHPVGIDVDTGAMRYCNTAYPAGFFTLGPVLSEMNGGVFEGRNLWMSPRSANMIVQLNVDTCVQTGYNSWPAAFSYTTFLFGCAVFDGESINQSNITPNFTTK